MKLISPEIGRVVQVFVADEIRPLRGLDLPRLIHSVSVKYEFAKNPSDLSGFNQATGLRFEAGRFTTSRINSAVISDLSIFNDGIVAGCANTDISDELIDQVIEWLVSIDLIRSPKTPKTRTYTSNLIVEFDKIKKGTFEKIFKANLRLQSALSEQYGWSHTMSLSRLSFSADPSELPPYRNTMLVIERRATIPYEKNCFWSAAPLPYPKHLKLLENIESDFL